MSPRACPWWCQRSRVNFRIQLLAKAGRGQTVSLASTSAIGICLPLNPPGLLDILLARGLVLGGEEAGGVLAEPLRQLGEFFAEAVDGLLVHVCLGNELGHGDW